VVKQFGMPDQVWAKDEHHPVVQYEFEKPFKTLKLVVKVRENGPRLPFTFGKQVKDSVNE
jgi:hypothetical protein